MLLHTTTDSLSLPAQHISNDWEELPTAQAIIKYQPCQRTHREGMPNPLLIYALA